jgi:2-amino-4-hydroxy-6-hydroxymethyldihydropteridine diphosphokinase
VKTVYLSVGSNLGDREARLREAIERLEASEIHILQRSQVYETEPQDVPDQGWFLNAVLEAETELFPMQLLAYTQRIEREMGRQHLRAGGPRSIDIDILLYGRAVVRTAQLEIPHPRMHARRFVLEPLARIAPGLRHPVTGKSVAEMLAEIQGQKVVVTDLTL